MKIVNKLCDELEEKIPRDAVSSRSAGGGRNLSYLKTWYVIDRLNKVFGNFGWDQETIKMRQAGTLKHDKFGELPFYIAKVRITAMIRLEENKDGYVKVVKEGYGYGIDKSGQNPHEMAVKEAESDALKRAAMKFGKSMGLALYDKSQEYVEDEKPKAAPVVSAVKEESPNSEAKKGPSRKTINESISRYAQVALKRSITTQDKLSAMLSEFGVQNKEQLTDEQANSLLASLSKLVNQ